MTNIDPSFLTACLREHASIATSPGRTLARLLVEVCRNVTSLDKARPVMEDLLEQCRSHEVEGSLGMQLVQHVENLLASAPTPADLGPVPLPYACGWNLPEMTG